ncbi:MAG: 4Fe-4S binding protein [Phycisphaerae bacterium]|jgi:ferredoxin-type protein NapH
MTGHSLKHLLIQTARRTTQTAVIVLLFALVWLSLYAHYRAARAVNDLRTEDTHRARLLTFIDNRVDGMNDPQAFLDNNKGTLWSMRLAGFDLTDPLAAVEMTATAKTVYLPLLLSILVPVVVTALLGRVFCSWICPAGLLFEVTGKLRRLLAFLEVPPAAVRFSLRNKYVFLVAGLLVTGFIGLPLFALVYPPVVVSRIVHAWVFGTALTGMVLLLSLIIVFEMAVSPRWWCRTMCPGGALYALIGWTRVLRVRLDHLRCTSCGACAPVCEPGIDPVSQSEGLECDNCGVCVRRCPDQALSYYVAPPRWIKRPSPAVVPLTVDSIGHPAERTESKSPKSRGGAPRLMLLAFVLLFATPVHAHHILGLPHYSYKDNYPQAPTLEYPATTGPYDVLLTSYPGRPVPGEPANLAIYIKDRTSGKPFDRPITVRLLQTYTFGRNREVLPATKVPPYEVPHKLTATFPEEGEYVLELMMEVEGATELIPFLMISGEPTATVSVLLAISGGLLAFLVVVRAIKIKQRRRRNMRTLAAASAVPG